MIYPQEAAFHVTKIQKEIILVKYFLLIFINLEKKDNFLS